MARHGILRSALSLSAWTVGAAACLTLMGTVAVVVSGWLNSAVEMANGGRRTAVQRGSVGDYFGGVNAAFSGLAVLLLVITLFLQQRELRSQREELALQREELAASRAELHRSAEADMRALHVQLTEMVMRDPSLAPVWTTYRENSQASLQQHLFANLVYAHFVLAHSWGTYSDADLVAHARSLLSSRAFQQYWNATREQKRHLSPQSPDGQVFQLFERALNDL
ncbi:DUF6082 family protein [Streptomyces sp. NPDC085900]|uniref:DUF6082 family protein n=1 Tax=Streptomyces sp. NPDC085900 TaxID=3365737 RepID=UPI0037D3B802